MTVGELIEKLKTVDSSLKVVVSDDDELNGHHECFFETYWLIDDFSENLFLFQQNGLSKANALIAICSKLAHEATDHVISCAREAISSGARHVVVLTHVPPWIHAHFHEGKPGSEEFHPYFTNGVMGAALEELANEHSEVQFTVFSGHTHGTAYKKVTKNMSCFVQAADYGNPVFERVVIKCEN